MRMGAEFWEAHVAAVKLGTISASEYARRNVISDTALYYWQRKLKPNVGAVNVEKNGKFVALRLAAHNPCLCTLVLPSGLHLEMTALPAAEWLVALERTLPGAH